MAGAGYVKSWREAIAPRTGVISHTKYVLRKTLLSTYSFFNKKDSKFFLRCLYCHYVFDDQIGDFDHVISKLKDIGKFVDTETSIKMLKGEREIDGKYFHLSFDDGFRNNYTNALPVLMKHGIPAIFFIPTSIVGADWETARAYCLNMLNHSNVIEIMNWDDVKDIVSKGYGIGSHGKTHARFSGISSNECSLLDEIRGSKSDMEDKLGIECKYISWPYGTLQDADNKSIEIVKESGYLACFGAFRGSIHTGVTDIFRIPRHHFEVQWPISHVTYFARGNMERGE